MLNVNRIVSTQKQHFITYTHTHTTYTHTNTHTHPQTHTHSQLFPMTSTQPEKELYVGWPM